MQKENEAYARYQRETTNKMSLMDGALKKTQKSHEKK